MERVQKKIREISSTPKLPKDFIELEILPKLPIESLPNFKLVCKSFNAIISSPEFIDDHLRRSVSNNTGRLLVLSARGDNHIHTFDFDGLESPAPSFHMPFLEPSHHKLYVLGSCNGLLCMGNLSPYLDDLHRDIMLLNPLTGMFFKISSSSERYRSDLDKFGFGFDDWSKDYKIVRISSTKNEINKRVMVYSLRSNSWKKIASLAQPDLLRSGDHGILMNNHLLHWIFVYNDLSISGETNKIDKRTQIGCFDLRTEKWVNNVELPSVFNESLYEGDVDNFYGTLGAFQGCLCFWTRKGWGFGWVTHTDMWVMKEYGVNNSWVKLLGVSDSIVTSSSSLICPLGLDNRSILDRDSGQQILLVTKHPYDDSIDWNPGFELIWYNMKHKTTRLSDVHNVHGVGHYFEACICTKSLVHLPGGSRIPRITQKGVQDMVQQHGRAESY